MDKLSGLNQLISLVRQNTATKTDETKSTAATGQVGAALKRRRQAQHKVSTKELEANLKKRLAKQLNAEQLDVDLGRRIILEGILVWEFGDELLSDVQLSSLVNKVNDAIRNNSPLSNHFNQWIQSSIKN